MRGKPGNDVLNTTVTNTQTLYLFLLFICTATTAHLLLHILLDMTSQMLFCTLPIASNSEQLASHASVSL